MSQAVSVGRNSIPPLLLLGLLLLLALATICYQTYAIRSSTALLAHQLARSTGIEAPEAVFQEAIRLTAQKLAGELGIALENYDISQAEYEALVAAAVEKFGRCEQYRLYPATAGTFSCFSCTTTPMVTLQMGQTYRIGQTCGGRKGRFGDVLPEPGLGYKGEYFGNIFDVLVAEQVKLRMYRFSKERQYVIQANNLGPTELRLPPGNKILR